MKEPSERQIKLLLLTAPKPYGKGLKIIQAAKLLHINYDAAKYALKTFKRDFPDRWRIIEEMKNEKEKIKYFDKKIKKALKRPMLVGAIDWAKIENSPSSYLNNPDTELLFDNEDSHDSKSGKPKRIAYLKIKEKF